MGTMANAQGYQTYLDRKAATERFYESAQRSLQTPSWTPPAPSAPSVPAGPRVNTSALPSGSVSAHAGQGNRSGSTGSFSGFFDILSVADTEDFWAVSDWMFEPIEEMTPRWLVIATCSIAAFLAVVGVQVHLQAGTVSMLLAGAGGFLAPLLSYVLLRLAVSAVTFLIVLGIFLGFVVAILAAAGAAAYGIFILAQAVVG